MAGNPIIEFYIQNYMWNNSLVTTETKFQEVPFSGDPVIIEPKVKNELGKAGSFEFKIESTSPYYNSLLQMKTLMRVTYFGTTIFRGRVLTIDKTMYGTRTVHCEGDFAFLLDSHQVGTKEDTRPEIGVLAYLQQIIAQHNSDVSGDAYKQFTLGQVPGQYTNATSSSQRVPIPSDKAIQKFGDSSWNTSMDRIESLLSTFGGYFRTRFVKGSGGAADATYLDWYDKYYNASTNSQTIEIAKNLIDLSGPTEIENLFTVVIPIGRDTNGENVYISDYWPIVSSSHAKVNYITVPELATIPLYTNAELNSDYHRKTDYQNAISRFGKIWKIVDFENANTPEKLFAYAKDWIKNNYMSEITQWSVTALDMKVVNSTNQVLLCGDRVTLTHPEVDATYSGMTIISADYDLYNPDKNKYVIGIPSQQINAAYGVKVKENKNTGSKGGGGGGITGGAGGRTKIKEEIEDDIQALYDKFQQQYILKTDYKQDILMDNPTAYLIYNTDGTEKTRQEATASVVEFMNKVHLVKTTQHHELLQEALRRGVSIDDYQLLVDFIPGEKRKQTWWKATTGVYLTNTVGLPIEQANVILNETAGESYLASLVDDNGNWTDYAISQGATIWNQDFKNTAIRVRKILQGTEKTQNGGLLSSFSETLSGLGLNIDNYLNFDYNDLTFNLGDIINTFEVPDAISGLVTKGVSVLTNLISGTSEEKNKTSGTGTWYEKAIDFIGGIFSGNNTENGGKQFSMLTDVVSGSSETRNKTSGTGTWIAKGISLGGNIFAGNNTETGGKQFSMLTNLITGSSEVKNKTIGPGTWNDNRVKLMNDIFSGNNTETGGKQFSMLSDVISGSSEEKNKSSGTGTWVEKAFDFVSGIFAGNNTEAGGKQFNLQSDNTLVDGVNAGIGLGANGTMNGWDVAINKPITYTANGRSYTVPAHSLAANDVHFTAKYDSLKANLAVVDTLLADYAQISTLVAMQAQIDTIDANYITASYITSDRINARIAEIPVVTIRSLAVTGSLSSSGYVYAPNFVIGSNSSGGGSNVSLTNAVVGVSVANNTLTLTQANGTETTFSKATTLSGAWSGNTLTVTATPQNAHYYQSITTGARQKEDQTAWSSVSDGTTFYIPVNAYRSGVTPPVYTMVDRARVDASDIYQAGQTSTSLSITYDSSAQKYKVYIVNNANQSMYVTYTNDQDSSTKARTITVKVGSTTVKTDTFNDYSAGQGSTNIAVTYDSSAQKYKVYVVNNASKSMYVTYTNDQNSSTKARTITVQVGSTTVKTDTFNDYSSGYSAGAPTGVTLGTKVTGSTWNVNITRSTGNGVTKQINLSTAYDDARSGYYTTAQYNAHYKEGWNDCIDACEYVDRYTRSATGGGGAYGGNNYTHYISYQGSWKSIGTGWYQTSYAGAYAIPDKK